jgi:translation initiation factor 2B subunit (eIF-2B alpha/beta/delta family)
MAKIDDKWARIFKKIQLILERNQKLEDENTSLHLKLSELSNHIKALNNEQVTLKEQIQYIKAAKEVHLSEKERAVTKQQLKEFMEEIDDCLAKLIQ